MKDKIIIKDKKRNYFFQDICDKYNVQEMYGLRTDKKLYSKLSKKGIYILGKWKRDIEKYDEVILFESLYNERVAKYIKRKNPNCRLILFFWNTIMDKTRKKYLKDEYIDEFWTFDPKDAEKYGINLNSQFYTKTIKLNEKPKEIDVLFLGRNKGRKEFLLDLESKLNAKGINTNIMITENAKDFVCFNEYLENIEKSKVILDIVIEGQAGLTLRCMESLFFKRKLITNNKEVMKYEFYNPNNIFILEKDNFEKINEFINSKYKDIDFKIVDYYDIENWLKRFDKKEGLGYGK